MYAWNAKFKWEKGAPYRSLANPLSFYLRPVIFVFTRIAKNSSERAMNLWRGRILALGKE